MPRIVACETARPPHRVIQEEARDFAARLFREALPDLDRLLPVFENTTIRERAFCVPAQWFETSRGFVEKNRIYVERGVELAEEAARAALGAARLDARDVDHVFFVSTTGIATPSLDAHLFNRLGFSPGIRRTPLWGLGCAGGLAGLIRASEWLRAYPRRTALVVALELCGLTFIRNDLSRENFVATSLFGDGCGAAVLAGDEADLPAGGAGGLGIEAVGSVTWPDTLDVMGWDVAEEGLRVIFAKSIPQIVSQSARPAIEEFLAGHGAALAEVRHFLAHPGGARVIAAYREALGFSEDQCADMREVLARNGNMSSATILYVMASFLASGRGVAGDLVLSAALGPGFSSEFMLSRCL